MLGLQCFLFSYQQICMRGTYNNYGISNSLYNLKDNSWRCYNKNKLLGKNPGNNH